MKIIELIKRIDGVSAQIARLALASDDNLEIMVYWQAFKALKHERDCLSRWQGPPPFWGSREDLEILQKIDRHFELARVDLMLECKWEG